MDMDEVVLLVVVDSDVDVTAAEVGITVVQSKNTPAY